MSDNEDLEFIEDKSEDLINHLIRQNGDIQGSVRIDVKADNKYDITVHKGTDVEVTKIRNVSKEKMLELMESRV